MKSRLHRIEIQNFKAFREFNLDLDGRHLLVYGANGAGKSSLYWALYTFLRSARKPKDSIFKYFDPNGQENLLNIHEQKEASPRPGAITLTLRDVDTKSDVSFSIGQGVHGTHNESAILKGDLASDFVTYRYFFGFSHFRNSDDFNVWPLFEREMLPFCVATGGSPGELEDRWNTLKQARPNPKAYRGTAGAKAFRTFNGKLQNFTDVLMPVVTAISDAAQVFYDTHFAADDLDKITLKLAVISAAYHSQENRITMPPVLRFGIQVNGVEVKKPQSFLNEAKMTQLALSVRFAASIVNLHKADLKLLVLDDLLVSLDMSNRMKVVEILLSEGFANYQKIILTHDLGFFQEFRRVIGSASPEWGFYQLTRSSGLVRFKSDIETALEYLEHDQITECGNRLRQCVEANLTTFLEQAKKRKGLDYLIDRDAFSSLHRKLNEATAQLSLEGYHQFAELLQSNFSRLQLGELTSPEEVDVTQFNALPRKKKGAVIAKLYAARSDLQQTIIELLSNVSRKRLTAIKLLDEVRRIKDRILNPASHAGSTPLYTKEAEDAIKVIQALDSALNAALATL